MMVDAKLKRSGMDEKSRKNTHKGLMVLVWVFGNYITFYNVYTLKSFDWILNYIYLLEFFKWFKLSNRLPY